MKLIIFADLHYYAGDRENAIFNKAQKLTQYAMPMLDELIYKVNNEYKPDAVINLGDSIQDSNTYDTDLLGHKIITEKLKEFNVPCYTVLGNHDMKMFNSRREIEKLYGYDNFTYSLDIGGYHLVFLTTELRADMDNDRGGIHKSHSISENEIVWLKDDLKSNNKPCIIFSHYAFFLTNELSKWSAFGNAKQLIDITERDKNIIATFAGHTHIEYCIEHNGIPYHVLGSPTACLQKNDIPDAMYYEVDIDDMDVKVTKHFFDLKEL